MFLFFRLTASLSFYFIRDAPHEGCVVAFFFSSSVSTGFSACYTSSPVRLFGNTENKTALVSPTVVEWGKLFGVLFRE